MEIKINDDVYHWNYGSGKVLRIETGVYAMPIIVMFNHGEESFDLKGKWAHFERPTLSFTPYNLVDGGFSQERPRDDIRSGDMIFVKNNYHNLWAVRVFSHFDNKIGGVHCFVDQKAQGKTSYWEKFSIEKPF